MEIKTLKDINFKDYTTSRGRIKRKLRVEAMKDIRAIRESEKNGEDFRIDRFCFYCCECPSSNHVIDYIKWKFNITEEDLIS